MEKYILNQILIQNIQPLNKIFIIDEASMINRTLEYILEHAAKQMCKVIFIRR